MNKQIKELAQDLWRNTLIHSDELCEEVAEYLVSAGYCKQSEGEWIKDEKSKFKHRYNCSVCNFRRVGVPSKYCEECGARMKGDESND